MRLTNMQNLLFLLIYSQREASVPRVVLATCKVGWPIYSCILAA